MRNKSKWKSVGLLSLLLVLLLFAAPAFAAETQTISIDPAASTKTVGDTLTIDVNYEITNDAASKGLLARLHYNSKKLTFVSLTNVYASDKLGQVDIPQDDVVANLDGDADTDKQVNVTWTNFAVPSAWPGTARTLFKANFTVNAGAYNGVTNVKLSNGPPPVGITVVTNDLALTITGGKDAPSTPVLSPVTGYYNSPQTVTATVDAAPIATYYTIDNSLPDTTKTLYPVAGIAVDGADGVAVTVRMRSYDAAEPVWSSEGSAVYTFDKANPTATFTAPIADAHVTTTALPIAGTADGTGSGVDKVEVSIDGGASWNNATGTTAWTYDATLVSGANALSVRVTDIAGNSAIVAGKTITYYPALVLKVGATVVTDQTVYVPNKAPNNTKTITVSGGSEAYSTYTWAIAGAGVGSLTITSANARTYTATIDAKGIDKVTVQDPIATTVFTAFVDLSVVDFSVTGDNVGYIGSPIVFTAQGNTGNVDWTVDSGAAVAGTPVTSADTLTATVTPISAGPFQLKAEDTVTSMLGPLVTVHTVPDFSLLPKETVTVNPGAASDLFTVSEGDGTYNWTVIDPSGTVAPGVAGATYTFNAPAVGNFAGTYVITAAESAAYSQTFNVYVPLKIDPATTAISIMQNAAPYPFKVTGAANTTPYTVTIDSLDDALIFPPAVGTFDATNTANYSFDPTAYTSVTSDTGSQDYSVEFDVDGLTAPPAVDMTVVPVKIFGFAGFMTQADGTPIPNVTVAITGPAGFKGLTDMTDALGEFTFAGLTAVDSTVFGFMAQETGFVSTTFKSTALAADGKTEIPMTAAGSSVSGNVGAVAQLSIFNAAGKLAGPIASDAVGDFWFDLPTAYSAPVDYTITAAATGLSGYTTVTADSQNYSPVNFVMAPVGASGYTVTAGAEPTGLSTIGAGGGTLDFSADPKLAGGAILSAFGPNAIKVAIGPVAGGNVVAVALPQSKTYTDTTLPITSGIQWEINGLGNNCVTIPVPCTMADALAVGSVPPTKSIYVENSGTPGTWTALVVDPANIYYNGDNSLIEVEVCEWSSNVLGIGNVASSISSALDDSGCFIGSLADTRTSGIAWLSIMAILAAGILIAVGRKQRN